MTLFQDIKGCGSSSRSGNCKVIIETSALTDQEKIKLAFLPKMQEPIC